MILFLDIDGVLHPDPAPAENAFCQRHLLWQILIERPTLQIVISSDWRLRYTLDYLADRIAEGSNKDIKQRMIGVVPVLPGMKHEYRGREQECLAWLAKHRSETEPWLALDDVAGNFTFGSPNLYLIDHQTGLRASDVARVLSLIS